MELIILQEARKELLLLACSARPAQGYLLGRQTGPGLFVEKIICLPWSELLRPEIFFRVEQNQGLAILGVFSLGAGSGNSKRLLRPLFSGKVFLLLTTSARGEIKPRARMIEFRQKFYFQPLSRIILELEAEDG
ncbi:MAG: hypothetical protein N3G18_08500 [Candidatus Saccharicenans sp.]|nr:hypothetical protein [Candidatus Saccharicenans sp.]